MRSLKDLSCQPASNACRTSVVRGSELALTTPQRHSLPQVRRRKAAAPATARSRESRRQPRQEMPPRACECDARSPTRPPAPQARFGTWTGARLERTGRRPGQSAARRSFGGQRGRWDGYSVVRATGWAMAKTALWCGVPWIRLGNKKSSDRSSAYLIHAWVTGVRCQTSLRQTALLNYVTTLRGFPTLESGESARGPCASRASERAAGAAL